MVGGSSKKASHTSALKHSRPGNSTRLCEWPHRLSNDASRIWIPCSLEARRTLTLSSEGIEPLQNEISKRIRLRIAQISKIALLGCPLVVLRFGQRVDIVPAGLPHETIQERVLGWALRVFFGLFCGVCRLHTRSFCDEVPEILKLCKQRKPGFNGFAFALRKTIFVTSVT